MTRKLPVVTAKEVIRVAERIGFVFDRQKGAMRFITGRRTSVVSLFLYIQAENSSPRLWLGLLPIWG